MDTQTIIIWSSYVFYILIFIIAYKKINHFEKLISLRILSNKYFNLVLFGFVVLFFLALLYLNSSMSDIPTHTRGAISIIEKGRISGRFLFALSVAIFSFLSTNMNVLISVAIVLLSLTVLFKYIISYYYTSIIIHSEQNNNSLVKIGSLLALFCSPIILYPFLNKLMDTPINVWHNATTIFLMPFALLLFFKSYQFLQGQTKTNTILILVLLVFLNIATKPSFFFVFCFIFPLFSFYKFRFKRQFFISLIPVLFGIGLIGLQYLFYYFYIPATTGKQSSVEFKLLYYFYDLKNVFNFVLVLVSNYAFPLLFLILYYKKISHEKILLYALSLFLASLFIKYSVFETGHRAGHGNFGWQVVVTGFIWFLISVQLFFNKISIKSILQKRDIVLLFSLGLHVVSFIVWFVLWSFYKMW